MPEPSNGGWHFLMLVVIGAIPGACARLYISNYCAKKLTRKYWGTCLVNLLAAFALGLLLALKPSYENSIKASSFLILTIGIGFLGSFSTFSTFGVEVVQTFFEKRVREGLLICGVSVLGGLLAAGLGYMLGDG